LLTKDELLEQMSDFRSRLLGAQTMEEVTGVALELFEWVSTHDGEAVNQVLYELLGEVMEDNPQFLKTMNENPLFSEAMEMFPDLQQGQEDSD